jgi:hypothetical protein
MQQQTGACPKCGAPIYVESPYCGSLPPPAMYTCNCHLASGVQVITTNGTEAH